jgi:predicted TPR repeat methyltransferase
MLEMARAKGVYRDLSVCDLSAPLDIASGQYRNAAAVGCLSPNTMSPMVIDAVLDLLPPGGCFVFSINDHAASDGTLVGRIMERTDCGAAELLFSEHGDHLPSIDLKATVYVLRNRG